MKVIQSDRRSFLKFFGRAGMAAAGLSVLPGCLPGQNEVKKIPFKPIQPSSEDDLILAEGFNYHVIAKLGDPINATEMFGDHNDYTAFKALGDDPGDGLLWVNHESTTPSIVSGYQEGQDKTKEQVELELDSVGGSINRIKKNAAGQWELVKNDPYNRRLHGRTKIPFEWDDPIVGATEAVGTIANCAGGLTPWGTILTCEENYHDYYGERDFKTGGKLQTSIFGWEKHHDMPPEHYGWVVEVDLKTGNAKKLIALGRCAHEAAAVHQEEDGICVVYTGDDKKNECLFKFIGEEPSSLKKGKLYVADTDNGRWISLSIEEQPVLQENFKDQTEVQIRLREAAKLVGGTPLDRPEDIEIDPVTGSIFVTLTNNLDKGNYHGSILKISEKDNNKRSLEFTAETFLAGGEDTGFSSPDNMVFDRNGNLWFCCDVSGSSMHKPPYEKFKNNGLFFVPMSGPEAGKALQVASGPANCEMTGPSFSPDYSTLFICVQHPNGHWPDGGNSTPRSAVVGIQGAALDALMS